MDKGVQYFVSTPTQASIQQVLSTTTKQLKKRPYLIQNWFFAQTTAMASWQDYQAASKERRLSSTSNTQSKKIETLRIVGHILSSLLHPGKQTPYISIWKLTGSTKSKNLKRRFALLIHWLVLIGSVEFNTHYLLWTYSCKSILKGNKQTNFGLILLPSTVFILETRANNFTQKQEAHHKQGNIIKWFIF